jgi:hypothetical protein
MTDQQRRHSDPVLKADRLFNQSMGYERKLTLWQALVVSFTLLWARLRKQL